MKYLDSQDIDKLSGQLLKPDDRFSFKCHPGVACFNRCCRNLNLFLYPYDVLRLKQNLEMTSDEFLDRHVDIILREGSFFPDVLLRMADNEENTCPFLKENGCSVYPDRPDTCRRFPVEQGLRYDARSKRAELFHIFRPPDFCLGQNEDDVWTSRTWSRDQEAEIYQKMTILWAELKRLFQSDPWGAEGAQGKRAKMAFMATYNTDRFREFVFGSSFLDRYKVKREILKKMQKDEVQLMRFGFEWVKLFLFGITSKKIRPRY